MNALEAYVEQEGHSVFAGTMYSHLRRGREGSSFRYDSRYISHSDSYAFEPAMPLSSGEFAFPRGLPRSFRDASPDRWGRLLIEKRLKQQWREDVTPDRTVTEVDYLFGTSDLTRQGALRFKRPNSEVFEAPGAEVPKMISLPSLLAATKKLCSGQDADDAASYAAVKVLLDAGTGSLGGARPKSSVADTGSHGESILYMAKFPHPEDQWDVMKWEKIAFDMAACAGIAVPENRLLKIDNASVLLSRRFDRKGGKRVGYMSAMTLLEAEEGQSHDYLDIADALTETSAQASQDLAELWRRIVFSLAINNTDDHLRNHALLRSGKAWRLSPAFDLNPNPDLTSQRVTSIGGSTSFEGGWAAIQEAREWFGLTEKLAEKIKEDVLGALRQWKHIASKNGATKAEMQRFAPALDRTIRNRDS